MPELIQSVHNRKVKEWSELLHKKGRDKQHKFLVEGVLLVSEALRSNAPIRTLVYSAEMGLPPEIASCLPPEVELYEASESVLAKCSDTETPQGVFAIAEKLPGGISPILQDRKSLVVVIDGVQDPGNAGTIIRSADAVAASGVVIGKGSVDVYNPKTVRSTMGSLFHLPVVSGSLTELLTHAKANGIMTVDARLDARESCFEMDFTGPVWFVIGNEANGVSAEVGALVERHVKIPMPGRAESLNAAMAATVLLYEALRQRNG